MSSTTASSSYGKVSLEQSLMNLTLAGTNAPSTAALSFLPHPPSPRVRPHHGAPSTSPTHSLSHSQHYAPSSLSNPSSSSYRPSSPFVPAPPLLQPTVAKVAPNQYPSRARIRLHIRTQPRARHLPTYPTLPWAFRQARSASAGVGIATTGTGAENARSTSGPCASRG